MSSIVTNSAGQVFIVTNGQVSQVGTGIAFTSSCLNSSFCHCSLCI